MEVNFLKGLILRNLKFMIFKKMLRFKWNKIRYKIDLIINLFNNFYTLRITTLNKLVDSIQLMLSNI